MGRKDPRVDAYIARSAEFAQPILTHLRKVVHEACPDVEETLKWSMPYFTYKGVLCHMAAFKQHCAFGFWKGALVVDDRRQRVEAMGQFGRITQVADLPPRTVLRSYIRRAMALNEAGVKTPARARTAERRDPAKPDFFMAALARNRKALATFSRFSPSNKREYVQWITQAKGEDTRKRRMQIATKWMAEGKPRHWKYIKPARGRPR